MKHVLFLVAILVVGGCQTDDNATGGGPAPADEGLAKPAPDATSDAQASPGKPTAPISIDYNVIGTPIVGHPVSIDVSVSSTQSDAPVKLTYRVLDADSLSFPDAQPKEIALGRVAEQQPAVRQVTVVPQREGRLYLNVTAQIETEGGALIKSIAIPIQVGNAPAEREVNGEVMEDADGDTVISMPADGAEP